MPTIRIDAFLINGVANGYVRLPCDGQTTVLMSLSLSVLFRPGDPPAAVVPVWIGRLGLFTWTTLVRDVMTFVAPSKPGLWVPVTHHYTLQCDTGCQLTPAGPASGRYTPDGDDIALKAGFYDVWQPLGLKWWFSPHRVRVSCQKRLDAVSSHVAQEPYQDSADDEKLLALAQRVKRGGRLRVNEEGQVVMSRPGRKRTG